MPHETHKKIHEGDLLAAVDLGSNSFHMVVARNEHGSLRVIDRLRDSVRLAAGLRSDGSLSPERRDRAFASLARFGQRLRTLPSHRIRAVATNTVRRLANPQTFLIPAETALNHPIEVVSGREEARLIYLGVAHGLPHSSQQRLVVDIGGGSTEFIIGSGFDAIETESLQMGCIASTQRFFGDGKFSLKRWRQAQTEIAVELQQFAANYHHLGWNEAIGSSGTAKAIAYTARTNGWCAEGISLSALTKLRDLMIEAGNIDKLKIPGLSEERAAIIAGGVAILEATFKTFELTHMSVCETAMREGLLYDMLGRAENSDPRARSIIALTQRYGVDPAQAARVQRTALLLFDHIAEDCQFETNERDLLTWCAQIHEIGLAIAHSQHHIHSAYILTHSDLPGFSRQEQQVLAAIIRSHRRKPDEISLNALPERDRRTAQLLIALLRLATLLHRARSAEQPPKITLAIQDKALKLQIPSAWLNQHPLTAADLEQEREFFKGLGLKLQVS